ncbi:MAG TPA: FAD-dependent monooxygenase, partial [Dehalococcoidia bacterium]|nr:FAD-dependent monooxygenase [Dehalococcoidia bacterium]
MQQRYDVAIIGGGPVGLALAVELGQRGISCALIERHLTPQLIPKGQNLTNRSLELFYAWGCVDELRAARVLPADYPIGGVTAYGNLMSEYWYTYNDAPGRGAGVQSYFFQRNERLPQYLTEQVLRNRLDQLTSVTTMFGWDAETIDQDDEGVRVTVAPVAEGAQPFFSWSADAARPAGHALTRVEADRQVIEARYLVGCDGGRSLVRESLGIDRGGRQFDQRMVLAVFRSRELHEGLKRFPERTTYRVLKPALKGYWQFFGRIDVGEGWFFHAPVPRNTTAENYDFRGLLQEAAGFQFAVDFDHVGFWDLRIMVASRYGKGRAFIAGDAAHQHPPYGGFGLNNGLEDVANLGWKLAAVLQGWGGEALLDSYSEERRPIFVETGEEMIAAGIERDRAFLERYNPERDRPEFEEAWQRMATGGVRAQTYEPHYEGSSMVMGPANGVCSIHGEHAFVARAGHHLAPQLLSSGRNVFEELGTGFTLLAFGADEPAVGAFEEAATSLGVPLKVIRDNDLDERKAYQAKLVLVRPDQYVAWAGRQAPPDAS